MCRWNHAASLFKLNTKVLERTHHKHAFANKRVHIRVRLQALHLLMSLVFIRMWLMTFINKIEQGLGPFSVAFSHFYFTLMIFVPTSFPKVDPVNGQHFLSFLLSFFSFAHTLKHTSVLYLCTYTCNTLTFNWDRIRHVVCVCVCVLLGKQSLAPFTINEA